MEMLAIRPFRAGDESAVIQLWRDCGLIRSSNDPLKDIQRKRAVQPELFLIALRDEKIVASVMAGYEGHRGWLNYLAVTPSRRQTGIGRKMVAEAERRLHELGCAKINLQVRSANTAAMEFYRRIGFQVDEVVSMGKRLIEDQSR